MRDWLAQQSDSSLVSLLERGKALGSGAGGGPVLLDVDGTPVFAKRVPLTDRELARPFSTANLFGLPVICQFGIGSPGFGAWRELAANQLVSGTPGFPALHHFRVLPGRPPVAPLYADIDQACARLGGSLEIRARLTELAAATHSLVLFFEHIPFAIREWLTVERVPELERQLDGIVPALRSFGLLHLDIHFGNIRTDGSRVYLADFGLATSPRFDLDPVEREFARVHAGHDAELVAVHLVNYLKEAGVAESELLTRLEPTAARLNAFYARLMGQ
ncbi:serine/threonine protein phosphatase [Lentzea sp. NPDC006480]|uniref:serine/threonine protein phosphatase n=1 Tax=Lentzea sp. NPDC006480 TaxID=3157176 RepID=UPI0033A8DAB8